MQPAYYEDLEEIQNKYWSMLEDAVTNRSSPFRIPVFMCSNNNEICLLYTSPSPRDRTRSRMPSSA